MFCDSGRASETAPQGSIWPEACLVGTCTIPFLCSVLVCLQGRHHSFLSWQREIIWEIWELGKETSGSVIWKNPQRAEKLLSYWYDCNELWLVLRGQECKVSWWPDDRWNPVNGLSGSLCCKLKFSEKNKKLHLCWRCESYKDNWWQCPDCGDLECCRSRANYLRPSLEWL